MFTLLVQTLTLRLPSALDARGRRESVRVDRLIAKADPILVEPSQRLLKQPRLRVTGRHGALDNIELVLVHVDPGKGTGLIGVVRELKLMSFDEVDGIPDQAREPGVALHESPRGIDNRSSQVGFPVPLIAR